MDEFKISGINHTNELSTAPDLNSCSHLICSDTYMQTSPGNNVFFIEIQPFFKFDQVKMKLTSLKFVPS